MRVAILNLTRGNLSGGYVTYLNHIVPLLAADRRIRDLHVLVPTGATLLPGSVHKFDGERGARIEIRRLQPDVVFVPTARTIAGLAARTVVMVRNMEPLLRPFQDNGWRECVLNSLRVAVARRACRSADRVIAVSDFVRRFLGRWHVPEERIGVVYHGVDLPCPDEECVRPACLAADLMGRFLFTAGSIRPARGLEDIVLALALGPPGVPLLIAGSATPGMESYQLHLQKMARTLGVENRVIWAGHLTVKEMSWCYRHCRAFVMSSRVEACPNVALEAMGHGCLCISTDADPMPEFFRQAALYYRPGDAEGLAARLGSASPVLRERALVRARQFTWESTASRTVEQLETALAARHGGYGRSMAWNIAR